MTETHLSRNGLAFLDQNPRAAATLTSTDQLEAVDDFAEHHAGGLIVLFRYTEDGRCMKMHDSWGDEDTVVVHTYDPDNPEDPAETVQSFTSGTDALAAFLTFDEGEVSNG